MIYVEARCFSVKSVFQCSLSGKRPLLVLNNFSEREKMYETFQK